jgi:hypothetical protein
MTIDIDRIPLDSEESELLALLKSTQVGHCLTDIEISDRLSWWVPQVFRVSVSLLSKGIPICFSSSAGWYDPASPEERETFWYARDQEDLDLMSKVIRLEVEVRQKMLRGLEVASAVS